MSATIKPWVSFKWSPGPQGEVALKSRKVVVGHLSLTRSSLWGASKFEAICYKRSSWCLCSCKKTKIQINSKLISTTDLSSSNHNTLRGIKICWSIELNDLWSKKICSPKIIVWSVATFILKWSCLKAWLVSLAFKRISQQRWSTKYKWRSHLKSSSLLSNPKVSRTRLEITPVLKCIGGDKSFTSYTAAHWLVGDCAGQALMWEKSLRCHQAEIRLHHEWSKRPSDPRDGHQP